MSVMTSSRDMGWATPAQLFNALDREFAFTLDPCCLPETAKCRKFYTPAEDGLAQNWAGERVFMNPPYGRHIGRWMRKAYEEARDSGALVVCLVPARVDTRWWHDYAARGETRFPKGRVRFVGALHTAPFPVAIVIFRPHVDRLDDAPKRRRVEAALVDPVTRTWSQGRIAKLCGVSQQFVSNLDTRSTHHGGELKTLGRDGRIRKRARRRAPRGRVD